MFLVLLKIKAKVYFEILDTQEEMTDFIDSIEQKFGEIEYQNSIIISGNMNDINEIVEMIEERYYLYIVGRKIDKKVYKELIEMINGLTFDVSVTFGIEFENNDEDDEPIPSGLTLTEKIVSDIIADTEPDELIDEEFTETTYDLYVYWFYEKVILSLNDIDYNEGYDDTKSFKQSFKNFDEAIALFEGFKHDFMEIISEETETMFTINEHLLMVHEFIENKIILMEWKESQPIKYFNGKYRQKRTEKVENFEEFDYLTAKEVMKKFRISDQTLANWRKNNLIDFRKISNRKYLYLVDSVNEIFENGIDTTGVGNTPTMPRIVSAQVKKIHYEEEIVKMLQPLAFKVPEYKFKKQNYFLNFGNNGLVTSPQVMINNDYQLVDFIKKSIIKNTPKELYEYLVKMFDDGREPAIDTSKKIQSDYSNFYLNKLYDKNLIAL
jgi:hypothetical protein